MKSADGTPEDGGALRWVSTSCSARRQTVRMRESRRGEPSQCRAGGRLPEWGRARRRRSDIAIDRSRARPSDAHPPGIRNGYRREVPNVIIKYNRPERYQPMSEYVYGNGDRVVSRNEFNPDYWHPRWESATYYHQDVLGSTSLMTNERGHTVERYTYDAFGVQTDGSFERVNEIGYTGQRYDPTTNMYNYGFRDYAPSIARFTTVDPIRDGNNWYAYVNNDPVNYVDPLGLESADAAYSWVQSFADAPDFRAPSGGRVTSDAGLRGAITDPRTGRKTLDIHTGQDYGPSVPGGTPESYQVAASGTVESQGYDVRAGGYLIIDNGNGYETHYYHRDIASMFDIGDFVRQGETLGVMGSSGIATAPHLHFGIKRDGVFIDPRVFLDRESVMFGDQDRCSRSGE